MSCSRLVVIGFLSSLSFFAAVCLVGFSTSLFPAVEDWFESADLVVVVVSVSAVAILLTVLINLAISSLERGDRDRRESLERAKREREFAQRQRELAQRQRELAREARRSALIASGAIVASPHGEIVICGTGGEPYKYCDFVIETRSVETEVYWDEVDQFDSDRNYRGSSRVPVSQNYTVTDRRVGCPVHRSTLWSFQNGDLNNFVPCEKCGYWFRSRARDSRGSGRCPFCFPAG